MSTQFISHQGLVDLLKTSKTIPHNAVDVEITVDVPSGGDWSNMELDVKQLEINYKLGEVG